ncbi:MAG TPA: septum formation initiator family protein [Verrucomicrobiae bacterium]|jgi:cell division protein FtsB|nr:septum formation initiator family protein [Verrucomicrobiae bacterium]
MNVDLGIWNKLTRVVIVLLLIAYALLVFVWYLPVIRQNERMRQQILRLTTEVDKEKETGKNLQLQLDALRNDPQAVELLARQLGFAKPNETILRFESAPTNRVTPQ